ncbi:low molecular weight protein-tyrosine-phosphatase [Devriesea agamarum]|uniref:low molecular weight protein-tyrosine-phosphatase n=1 Tax=Devriesea agamarum TaxID=472569 RepID=UPI00071DE3F6|nr:low molecular weight protein-tyrosine-phosphatase [Devriesea agamarum]
MTFRIVTVCTGNICRSPMAEYLLRRAFDEAGLADQVEIDSAATSHWEVGNPIDRRAAAVMDELGIDTLAHRAREVSADMLRERDLILAMDHDHLDGLRALTDSLGPQADSVAGRIHLMRSFDPEAPSGPGADLGIRDPWYGGSEDFERTLTVLRPAVAGVVDYVRTHCEC